MLVYPVSRLYVVLHLTGVCRYGLCWPTRRRAQWANFLHDVEILYITAFFLPAVGFPVKRPFGNNVYPKFAVGIYLAWLAVGVF